MTNFRNFLLGIGTLGMLCVALIVQVLYTNAYLLSGSWALTGLCALVWFLLNRQAVVRFLTRRSTLYGANVALVLFLVLGILVFVNVIAKQHPLRKDFTRTGANTLSEQT